MDQRPGPVNPRSLLICLTASLAVHAVILLFVGRTETPDRSDTPDRQTLSVELERYVQKDDPQGEHELIEAEAESVSELLEPEVAEAEAATKPSATNAAQSKQSATQLRLGPLDVRNFVKSYEANHHRPDPLPFRPDLKRRLEARQMEQHRVALVEQNRADRFGHAADVVSADGVMTRLGNNCYVTSRPAITIQRGQEVAQVECPGKAEWWNRADLNEVATFRGIP